MVETFFAFCLLTFFYSFLSISPKNSALKNSIRLIIPTILDSPCTHPSNLSSSHKSRDSSQRHL